MPHFYTFTGPLISPLRPLFDEKGDPLDPEAERTWLRDNPRQVARTRRVEVLLSEKPIKIIEPMFVFSLRVLDPREADGWRLATVGLPAVATYCDDKEETLDEAWPNMKGDPAKESDFVLSALMEAVYVGESWAEPILRSLVLPDTAGLEARVFDPVYATRSIGDFILNSFVARHVVGRFLDALRARGLSDAKVGQHAGLMLDELRKGLEVERTRRAEALFRAGVATGSIQFRLRVDGRNWQMPWEVETTLPTTADPLLNAMHAPLQRSLFTPTYRDDFNNDERDVAVHLDSAATVQWWHRNVARHQYGLQGWKRSRIYPDFIFAASAATGKRRIVVLETKGDQLAGNLDTSCKEAVLSVLSGNFDWNQTAPVGEMQLVKEDGLTVHCSLVLMSDIPTQLPPLLGSGPIDHPLAA